MSSPCAADCTSQRYPRFPYEDAADTLFTKGLPIMLSATVVVISWLAGRFIDKMEMAATKGTVRPKSVSLGALKRSEVSDGDFHLSRGGPVSSSEHGLESLSLADDEGRLYNETYGSEHSRDDGDRYDALGDSPGAQGPSTRRPRSPSVYSHFSQSVFSQSAYGPSAYGPSQRRPSGNGILGVPGYVMGSGTYELNSSHTGSGASHYTGRGASQLSERQMSLSGASHGNSHVRLPHGSRLGSGQMNSGTLGSSGLLGPLGRRAGPSSSEGPGHPGSASRVPPSYYSHAVPVEGSRVDEADQGMDMEPRVHVGLENGEGEERGDGRATYPSASRGSPPPYAEATTQMLTPASVLPVEPRPSVDPYVRPVSQGDKHGRRELRETAIVTDAAIESDAVTSKEYGEEGGGEIGASVRTSPEDRGSSDLQAPALRGDPGSTSGFCPDLERDGNVATS